jgi:tetratricopeptide (TPR) repeat protein
LEWYRRTLAKDGGFARAYEGMAETHLFYGFLGILPEKVAYPKAKELSEKALEIDGSLSGSHYILGRILTEYYWRRDAGEAEYRRAIDLAPNNPTARLAYSWLLASRLDRDGASGEAEKAVELDPKSTEAWWSGAYTFYLLGEFDREVEYGRRAVELNPKDPIAHLLTSFGYLFSERPEDAVREAEEASSLANRQSYYQANLAGVYGFAGRKEAATRLLTQLLEFSKTEHVQAAMMAWAFASIGDLDGFFHWYQRAVDERSSYIAYMANEPSLRRAGILADPRFRRIMEQAGLSL